MDKLSLHFCHQVVVPPGRQICNVNAVLTYSWCGMHVTMTVEADFVAILHLLFGIGQAINLKSLKWHFYFGTKCNGMQTTIGGLWATQSLAPMPCALGKIVQKQFLYCKTLSDVIQHTSVFLHSMHWAGRPNGLHDCTGYNSCTFVAGVLLACYCNNALESWYHNYYFSTCVMLS